MKLGRLWRGRGSEGGADAPPRPARPTVLIGDIHGRDDLLGRLLSMLRRHEALADADPADLVFLGDLVDRGPSSRQVLDRIRVGIPGRWHGCHVVRGNHEDMMLDFLSGEAGPRGPWLANGGVETLRSFGVEAGTDLLSRDADPDALEPDALENVRAIARTRIGASRVAWLSARPRLWQSGNLVAVHAALDPRCPPSRQTARTLAWGRGAALTRPRKDGLWVAHGHTVMRPAALRPGYAAIDTGAWFSNDLTALICLPGEAPRLIGTRT